VPLVGFVYVFGYVTFHWLRTGRNIKRVKDVIGAFPAPYGVDGVVEIHAPKDVKVEEAELSRSS
jgi:MFS transporter, FHS family, L-fucose permease